MPHADWPRDLWFPWHRRPPAYWVTRSTTNRHDRRRATVLLYQEARDLIRKSQRDRCRAQRQHKRRIPRLATPDIGRRKVPMNVLIAQLQMKRGELYWPFLPKRFYRALGLVEKKLHEWTTLDFIRVGAKIPLSCIPRSPNKEQPPCPASTSN